MPSHSGILQKAVDELKAENPKLDYIRGLLETLIELAPKPAAINNTPFQGFTPPAAPIHIGASGKPAIVVNKPPEEPKE